jgi:hypothetical protein
MRFHRLSPVLLSLHSLEGPIALQPVPVLSTIGYWVVITVLTEKCSDPKEGMKREVQH